MPQTVLITGASTGIGRAAAERFHAAGWNVAASMRSPEKAEWIGSDDRWFAPRLDVTRPDEIQAGIKAVLDRFDRIDVLVNNAGYGLVGPFELAAPEQIERQFQTNVFGLMNVCRALLPHFRAQQNGTLINVASMGGRITFPLYSLYHATKWAVDGFSESLQYELRPFNVRVKIIEPGPIKTDFYGRSMDLPSRPDLKAYDDYVGRVMPRMDGAGRDAPGPALVADAIYRAATDGSWRLRYTPNATAILALRRLLPDSWFQATVRRLLNA